MNKPRALLPLVLALIVAGSYAISATGGQYKSNDNMHVVYLNTHAHVNDVVEVLRMQLLKKGWQTMDVNDIDHRIAIEHDSLFFAHNKQITAVNDKYIARNIRQEPLVSLVIPQDIVVFRKQEKSTPGGDYTDKPYQVGIAFLDPQVKAKATGIKLGSAAKQLRADLTEAVAKTEAFFEKQGTARR